MRNDASVRGKGGEYGLVSHIIIWHAQETLGIAVYHFILALACVLAWLPSLGSLSGYITKFLASWMPAVCCLELFLLNPQSLPDFYHHGTCILSNTFSTSNGMIILILFISLLTWQITFIEFTMLSLPWISGLKPSWSRSLHGFGSSLQVLYW